MMTVTSETNKSGPYTGNGVTKNFSVTFDFFDDTDIQVFITESGVDTLQTLTTHYTVTGGSGITGTVIMISAPSATQTLTILRNQGQVQETDYIENDPFSAQTHEDQLDKLVMMIQEHEEKLTRALRMQVSTSTLNPVFPEPSAGEYIRWNSGATALETVSVVGSGTSGIGSLFEDTSPQLASFLDCNGYNLRFDAGTGISDDTGSNTLLFTKAASAVNYYNISNSATGVGPNISVLGTDTNIDMGFQAKGTGAYNFYGTSTSSATLRLFEDTDNGSNYIELHAPSSLASNIGWTLPGTVGSANDVLSTDGGSQLSWRTFNEISPASSSSAGSLRMYEDTDNGSNYMAFQAPAAVTANVSLVLPNGDGSANQFLTTNGSSTLAWTSLSTLLAAATQANQETGTSTTTYVTPGRQHYHPSAAKGWVSAGTTGNILASYGVSSLTDIGTGHLQVTLTTSFSSANYCLVSDVSAVTNLSARGLQTAAGTFRVICFDLADTLTDPTSFHAVVFGDQ